MTDIIINQKNVLLLLCLIGAAMGLSYDLIRIYRRAYRHRLFLIHIEDLLYFLIWAVIVVWALRTYNNGEVRLYVWLGLFGGAAIYYVIIGRFLIKVVEKCKKKG